MVPVLLSPVLSRICQSIQIYNCKSGFSQKETGVSKTEIPLSQKYTWRSTVFALLELKLHRNTCLTKFEKMIVMYENELSVKMNNQYVFVHQFKLNFAL